MNAFISKIKKRISLFYRNLKMRRNLEEFALRVLRKTKDKELANNVLVKSINLSKTLKKKEDLEIENILNELVEKEKKKLKIKRKAIKKRIYDIKHEIDNEIKKVSESKTYLISSEKKRILQLISSFKEELKSIQGEFFNETIKKSLGFLEEKRLFLEKYNEDFVEERKKTYSGLFKKAPFELDDEQKTAIVKDDKYNLVVAGAGSGKTEVLTTKIAYLIKREPDGVKPKKILALAFQKDAKKEIEKRLKERYGLGVEVRTFHSLGRQILKHAGKKFQLKFGGGNFEKQYGKFVNKLFDQELTNPEFQRLVINYIKVFGEPEKKEKTDFSTKEEYYQYMRNLRYTALDGSKVKSEAERKIMNFLLTHKINGKPIIALYEAPVEWMAYQNSEGEEIIPKPDFFLKDVGLYIEHWSIDKMGNVPEWFENKDSYKKGMKLKREKFKKQGKYSLMETYSHEFYGKKPFQNMLENRLLKHLEKQFPDKEFEIQEIEYGKLVNNLWDEFQQRRKSTPKNVADFIRIAKAYNLTSKKIKQRLERDCWSKKQRAFAKIALLIYEKYEKELKKAEKIDFADMINQAVNALEQYKELYRKKFDYILVDEFQDISKQRFLLLKSLMRKNPNCKLFCVGDDWQSIMAFSGANIDYFTKFGEHIGSDFARTDLSTNYRSNKLIVDTGATIIQHNGPAQLSKKAIAKCPGNEEKKIVVYELTHKKEYSKKYYEQMADLCTDKLIELLESREYKPEDIMILSRIKAENSFLTRFLWDKAKEKKLVLTRRHNRPDAIRFFSVHQSKGQQARIVFILDVKKDLYGFPCELEDAEILEPAVDAIPKNKEEEERRLFYVAITRAKEDVIIYTMAHEHSKFLKEIKEHVKFQTVNY